MCFRFDAHITQYSTLEPMVLNALCGTHRTSVVVCQRLSDRWLNTLRRHRVISARMDSIIGNQGWSRIVSSSYLQRSFSSEQCENRLWLLKVKNVLVKSVRCHRVRCMKPCYLLVWMLFSWLGVAVFVTVNGIRASEFQVLAVAYWRMVLRQIKMDTAQKAHSTLFYIQYTDSQYDFCVTLNVRSSCL